MRKALIKSRCKPAILGKGRGQLQPRCGCNSCWEELFKANPGKVLAAALAIKKLGVQTVINAQGQEFFEATKGERVLALVNGKRHAIDKAAIIENRGRKYVKQLNRFLGTNPLPPNAFEGNENVEAEYAVQQ